MTREELIEVIRPVTDPEIGISIVDLGLIYDAQVTDEGKVHVTMTLTSPGCPAGPEIMGAVDASIRAHTPYDDVAVELVWEPKWDPEVMASDEGKDVLGIW